MRGAAEGASPLLSGGVGSNEASGSAHTTYILLPPPAPAQELKTKKRYGRLQKAMGDHCLLAGSPLDAQDHYSTGERRGLLVFWVAWMVFWVMVGRGGTGHTACWWAALGMCATSRAPEGGSSWRAGWAGLPGWWRRVGRRAALAAILRDHFRVPTAPPWALRAPLHLHLQPWSLGAPRRTGPTWRPHWRAMRRPKC